MVGDWTLEGADDDAGEDVEDVDDMILSRRLVCRCGLCWMQFRRGGVCFFYSVFLALAARLLRREGLSPSQAQKPELMGYFPYVFFFRVCFFTCSDKA